ncbi:MAG TPA: PAS domain-containing protein [Verrucomicrobiae bacterium]|nr:PAS domain-containing protein [Verrucomicrobiae bacterium]
MTTNSSRRILIVDDNPAIHQDFRKILGNNQSAEAEFQAAEAALFGDIAVNPAHVAFEMDFAFQGEEALQMAQRAQSEGRPYAMAFMDVRMPPGWDGIETTAKIWEVDPQLQIAFCTAYADYSWEAMSAKLGNMDSFVILKKPFEVVEVLQLANAFTAKWNLAQETKLHMQRLQESEHRYEFLTNTIPGIVWTSRPDGAIDYANRRADEYFGADSTKIADGDWAGLVHPEDAERVKEQWQRSIASGEVFETEYRLKAADGIFRWHLGRAHPLRDQSGKIIQWVGTATNIEDQKRAEQSLLSSQAELEKRVTERTEALARERDLLQALMDNLPDCIFFKDADSRFTRINQAHARMLGLSDPQKAIGKTDANFLSSRLTRQALVDERRIFATGEPMLDATEQVQTAAGETIWISSTKVPLRDAQGNFTGLVGVSRDITERKRFEEKLAYERELLRTLLENSPDFIYFKDRESRFLRCSRTLARRFGELPENLIGKRDVDFFDDDHSRDAFEDEQKIMRTGEPLIGKVEQEKLKSNERVSWVLTNKMPLRDEQGKIIGTFGISKDITALKEAELGRQMSELQLRQSQKLEAIGQLAAGIAHEINTPTQYVGDNTRFLKDSFDSIFKVVQAYGELLQAAKHNSASAELIAKVDAALAAADLDYLSDQVPAAIRETLEGVERVTKIVRAMKEFSHPGGSDKTPADLNKAIETTTTVARNEWKYVADLDLQLDPALPLVPCLIGEFNQVILNLVVNAAHAIGDVVKDRGGEKGRITIRTTRDGEWVEVRVSDTGAGIREAVRPRIFEPFFTTKAMGKGSGQGLAMVYGSVVHKHGGSVNFETEVGQGTTFILRLPIVPASDSRVSSTSAAGFVLSKLVPAASVV